MAEQALRELRAAPRYTVVNKQLPGDLLIAESAQYVFAVAVDASKFGLGVVIAEELDVNTQLVFVLDGWRIPLRVAWNKKRGKNLYRHGLEVTDKSMDIEELLFARGCLEVNLDDLTGLLP
jgi:hypothetical protein